MLTSSSSTLESYLPSPHRGLPRNTSVTSESRLINVNGVLEEDSIEKLRGNRNLNLRNFRSHIEAEQQRAAWPLSASSRVRASRADIAGSSAASRAAAGPASAVGGEWSGRAADSASGCEGEPGGREGGAADDWNPVIRVHYDDGVEDREGDDSSSDEGIHNGDESGEGESAGRAASASSEEGENMENMDRGRKKRKGDVRIAGRLRGGGRSRGIPGREGSACLGKCMISEAACGATANTHGGGGSHRISCTFRALQQLTGSELRERTEQSVRGTQPTKVRQNALSSIPVQDPARSNFTSDSYREDFGDFFLDQSRSDAGAFVTSLMRLEGRNAAYGYKHKPSRESSQNEAYEHARRQP